MHPRLVPILAPLFLLLVCAACPEPKKPGSGGPVPTHRCEANLTETGLFSGVGTSARARVISDPAELIGGQTAEGRMGDVLLENDRIRVIISQPGRNFAPVPYGGWIVDADLQRPDGEAGRDQFGRLGMLHAFGRTIRAEHIDILETGETGGPAIVAVTGPDTLNDFIHIDALIGSYLPNAQLATNPDQPLTLKATTYYVLSPGETRVRIYTQYCNEGGEIVSTALGDIVDPGGTVEVFNPTGCSGGLGAEGCLIDPAKGFGFQGDGVAYGYRGYRFDNLQTPSDDALLSVSGTVGVLAGAESSNGVLSWTDAQASKRPGTFGVKPGERRAWLRDFYVTRDLAELTSTFLVQDSAQQGRLKVTVTTQSGEAAAGARVAVVGGSGKLVTLMVTDADGQARADVAPGTYKLYVGQRGHAIEAPLDAMVGTNGTSDLSVKLGPSRVLTVNVKDPFGAGMPAKVTVLCPTGSCPTSHAAYSRLFAQEPLPTNVAAVGFVPPSGALQLRVAPGTYEIVVTRGPEYSAWPLSWPNAGEPVDLSTADANLNATLARVVDTTGWVNVDLHVHAVNSADTSVANEERVLSFLAEGVDVLVSTDHDYLTDFGPTVKALGGEGFMATMVGSELSTFDFGHFNAYPMNLSDAPRGGPFDWAGGEGATMRATQMFAGVREQHPDAVIQLNHPRGSTGIFSRLQVDTDTLATHADPLALRMDPAPDASATDTRLMDSNFDAIEVANGLTASNTLLNDWFVQLSTGRRKAATAVSDTHKSFSTLGGYSRTYVQMQGADSPSSFDPKTFAQALKAQRAIGTNGPFMQVTARKLDAQGMAVGDAVPVGGTLSVAPASSEQVELTIDVQLPEWMRFDRLEVFTHADGREALNGEGNSQWQAPVAFVDLDPAAPPIEAVPGTNGFNVNRVRVTEKITVTPAADTWYVVILRSSTSVPTMFPLAYSDIDCDGNLCTADAARPYAFSNPIYVDADGSGAYDKFPQKIARSLRYFPPAQPTRIESPRTPTLEELNGALRELLHHDH